MSRYATVPLVTRSFDALTIQLDDVGSATDNRGYYITTISQRGEQASVRLKVDELRALVEWVKNQGDDL